LITVRSWPDHNQVRPLSYVKSRRPSGSSPYTMQGNFPARMAVSKLQTIRSRAEVHARPADPRHQVTRRGEDLGAPADPSQPWSADSDPRGGAARSCSCYRIATESAPLSARACPPTPAKPKGPTKRQPREALWILLSRNALDGLCRSSHFQSAAAFETARFSRSRTSPRVSLHDLRRLMHVPRGSLLLVVPTIETTQPFALRQAIV